MVHNRRTGMAQHQQPAKPAKLTEAPQMFLSKACGFWYTLESKQDISFWAFCDFSTTVNHSTVYQQFPYPGSLREKTLITASHNTSEIKTTCKSQNVYYLLFCPGESCLTAICGNGTALQSNRKHSAAWWLTDLEQRACFRNVQSLWCVINH
mgnify:CR=1 FL=1